ncbi:MAG: Y-family DNA polymerase [Rubripirellula sp.]
MKRLLCIWLPNWPIQRLQSELRQAAERDSVHTDSVPIAEVPIVLWNENSRRGRLVVACCHAAAQLGVRVSMKLAEAADLVRSSANSGLPQSDSARRPPLIQRHDKSLDQRSLEQIAVSVQRQITPKVALEELAAKPWAGHPRHQCESLLCDTSGVSHLFGDESGLLVAVEAMLAARHVQARMAIADSVAASWALAHEATMKPLGVLREGPRQLPCGGQSPELLRKTNLAEKLEGSERSPGGNKDMACSSKRVFYGGLIIRGDEGTARAIEELPVQSLRLATDTVSTLARLGVVSVSQLLSLPRSGLATRLGPELVRRLEQVQSEVDEPLKVHQAEAEYSVTLALEYPTTDLEILTDRIKRLGSQLTSQLMVQQRGVLRLRCCMELSGAKKMRLDVGLFAPTVDADHLSGLVVNQLESVRIQEKVERLSLLVTLSGALRSSQASFFELEENSSSATGMTGVAISRLVDALTGRMGRERVGYLELQNDPLPERAFEALPLAGNASSPVVKRRKKNRKQNSNRWADNVESAINRSLVKPTAGDALRRPLSLLADPLPLRVAWHETDFSLRVSSSRLPQRIRFNGVDHQVLNHWGPERIESGWWRGKSIRRDYYRVETDQGEWWWIFRNLVSQAELQKNRTAYRWMLHGRFS